MGKFKLKDSLEREIFRMNSYEEGLLESENGFIECELPETVEKLKEAGFKIVGEIQTEPAVLEANRVSKPKRKPGKKASKKSWKKILPPKSRRR